MRRVWIGGGVSALVATFILAITGGGPVTCDRTATTSTFAAQIADATAGQTLCLAAGTYEVPKVDKDSPGVTLRPAPGVTRAQAKISTVWNNPTPAADWLIFDGLTVVGSTVSAPSTNITWRNSDFVTHINIDLGGGVYCGSCPAMDEANLLFEGNDFSESLCPTASGACQPNHGRMAIFSEPAPDGAGITIRNNHFVGNVCGDGIQFGGNAGLGVLIQGNHFGPDLTEAACIALPPFNTDPACTPVFTGDCPAPHADPIQGVGSIGWVAEDNFIDSSSTGFVNYDGISTGVVLRNNVIEAQGDAICLGGGADTTIEHNTVISGGVYLCVNHTANPSTDVIWRNNIMPGPPQVQGSSTYAVNDYNLCLAGTCDGAHSLNGTPVWVDGLEPSTFTGFALAAGSPGKGVASDGTDIGVNP